MRVCVTGAAGFVGANLVARLKADGHWVRAVDIKHTPHRAHLYEQADVFELRDLRDEFPDWQEESWLFHFAADHGGAGYFHSPADFKAAQNNLEIDRRALQAAKRCDRTFFASSACTYPVSIQGRNARALREDDWGEAPAEALYGEAKRMSTLLFEQAHQFGVDTRAGLFHTIYGPTQDYQEPRAKFPTAICRKIIEDPERVEIWGDGRQVRTFLYIEDALDRIMAVMESDVYFGPVNIGSDEEVTVQQCADWVAAAASVEPEWMYTDGPVGVEHRASDNSEWNRRYGRRELTPARDGFAQTYGWLVKEMAAASVKGTA